MTRSRFLVFITLAFSTIGSTAMAIPDATPVEADPNLRAQLDGLARRKIFFGHNSVGASVLDGLRRLSERSSLTIREVSGSPRPAAGITHGWIPRNGEPIAKLRNFAALLSSVDPSGFDIALIKLCYADFGAGTDSRAIFAAYQTVVAELKARHPRTTFIHVTTPLTTVQTGPKAWAKRIMGDAPWGLVENARRHEFNELLRGAYHDHEPVFDLAKLESTGRSGAEVHVWEGRTIPALVTAYTDDGGHLNAAAQLRAARELVTVLASVPPRDR